jgi:peptide/nickel transport system permease protein
MSKFVLRRIGLALITLFLISVLVFIGTQLLPGDVGRRILGPFATQEAVDALNNRLGTDRPVLVQYWDWITSALTGDLGFSISFSRPVTELLGRALVNSLKLAALAFVIVVPLSLLGGILAALKRGKLVDRLITVGGLSATVIPEFVSGIVLIVVFAVWLGWLPGIATAPPGSSFLTQMRYLILPAIPLVLVLFGYIARITRAGVVEALDADYTRTAILKGLPRSTVIRRDVLRNALLPTIGPCGHGPEWQRQEHARGGAGGARGLRHYRRRGALLR